MQLGFTLFEDMVFDGGQVTNASLADYKIPGIHDIPPMESVLVAAEQTNGPFGAKGIGESGTFGVSPAIANAIDDAVGVRLFSLPLTAEAVLRALREKAGQAAGAVLILTKPRSGRLEGWSLSRTCTVVTPGTISTGTPAWRQAAISVSNSGSPPISRTTRRPALGKADHQAIGSFA